MIFILILYDDELKWHTNSDSATLGHALLNVRVASKVHRLHSCWKDILRTCC